MKTYSATEVNRIVGVLWPQVHDQMKREGLSVINEHHRNRIADLAIRVLCGELAEGSGSPECRVHEVVRNELPHEHSDNYYGHLNPDLQNTYTRTIAIARELLSQSTATLNIPVRIKSVVLIVDGEPIIETGDPKHSEIALGNTNF